MSIYDILMLVVLVGCILFGLWKGLAWQVASLASLFVSYFVALNFRGVLSGYISATEPWNQFAAMLILFIGSSLIVWLAYGYMKATIERWRLRGFDTQAGGLLGALKGALLCMLITLFAVTLFGENVTRSVIASRSGGYITSAINHIYMMVPDEIHPFLNSHIEQLNKSLEEESPGFVGASEEKLENKLKIIRGQFNVPSKEQQLTGPTTPTQSGFAPPPRSNNNVNPDLGDRLKQAGNEFFDATKEAGRQVLEENFNR